MPECNGDSVESQKSHKIATVRTWSFEQMGMWFAQFDAHSTE